MDSKRTRPGFDRRVPQQTLMPASREIVKSGGEKGLVEPRLIPELISPVDVPGPVDKSNVSPQHVDGQCPAHARRRDVGSASVPGALVMNNGTPCVGRCAGCVSRVCELPGGYIVGILLLSGGLFFGTRNESS